MQIPSSRGITFTGLGSGLDTNSIVRQLVRLETAPVQRLQSMQNSLSQQRSSYQKFKAQLSGLGQAAAGLTRAGAFNINQTSSSNNGVASILSSGSASGNFDLSVQRLATAHSVASRRFESADSELGLSGEFSINGRAIQLQETDTARTLAQKVNAVSAGVRASIVENSDGSANLRLTSLETGASGRIQFSETQGGSALGFSDPVTQPPANPTPPGGGSTPTLRPDQIALSTTERTQLNGPILRTNVYSAAAQRVTNNGGNVNSMTGAQFASTLHGTILDNATSLMNDGRGLLGAILGTSTNGERLVAGVLGSSEVAGFRAFATARGVNANQASTAELAFHLTDYALQRAAQAGGRSWVDWRASSTAPTAFGSAATGVNMSSADTTRLLTEALGPEARIAFEHYMRANSKQIEGASVGSVASDLQRFFSQHASRLPNRSGMENFAAVAAGVGVSAERAQLIQNTLGGNSSTAQALQIVFPAWSNAYSLDYSEMTDEEFAGHLTAFAFFYVSSHSADPAFKQASTDLANAAGAWRSESDDPPAPSEPTWNVVQSGEAAGRRLLQSLGFAEGATSRAPDGLVSQFISATDLTMGKLLGVDGDQTLSMTFEGQSVSFSTRTTTVEQFTELVSRLDGVSARILQDGNGRFQMQIAANDGNLSFSDPSDVLGKMGMLGRTSTLTEAQDAQFTVNGTAMTSASNTVTNAVQGATILLNSAGAGASTRFTFDRSAESAVNLMKGLAAAFNAVEGFVRSQSAFDQKTFSSGELFADGVARQAGNRLLDALYGQSNSGTFRNITQIGFSRGQNGELNLNEAALRSALDADAGAFERLFGVTGTTTGSGLRFVSGGDRTRETGQGAYDVEITQLATQSQVRASRAQTDLSAQSETLTFSGGAFAGAPITLTLASGSSLSDTVNTINNDSRLQGKVTASVEDGRLTLTSAQYGSGSGFDVVSDRAASSANSGIGTAGTAVRTTGRDVAGRINGEEATGMGQLLMGNVGNAKTEGLQLEYTGTTTGRVGTVKVEKGVAARLGEALDSILNPNTGLIAAFDKSIETKIDSLGDEIAEVQQRAAQKELALRARFQAMEEMMARSQAQMAKIQSFMDNQRAMGSAMNPISMFGGNSAA